MVALAFLALAGTGAVVSAGPPPSPPDSSSGKTGAFGWETDTGVSPAGSCRYGRTIDGTYYNYLKKVGVDAPTAYASANRETQRIGVRLTIQRANGLKWTGKQRSDWVKKTATQDNPAPFRPMSLTVPVKPGSALARRAKVDLRWYRRDGHTVAGKARMFPDFYEAAEMGVTHTQTGHCGGTTG